MAGCGHSTHGAPTISCSILDLLSDLRNDSEHAGFVANLEGCYLQPLEQLTEDPALLDAVMEVRRNLAQTHLSLRKLALAGVGR